jgi:hypothetical protein
LRGGTTEVPLVGGDVRVQALGCDALIVRAPGLCSDPEFVERVVGSLARAARPGRRLDYRDELLRELAARHYVGSTAARAKQLLADVRRYETTRWRFDRRRWAICPRDIEGALEEHLWRVLKVSPRFPGLRQLQNILPSFP